VKCEAPTSRWSGSATARRAAGVAALGAEWATIEGKGHSVPETGDPCNRLLERFLTAHERGAD
jgi:hypothetical protein